MRTFQLLCIQCLSPCPLAVAATTLTLMGCARSNQMATTGNPTSAAGVLVFAQPEPFKNVDKPVSGEGYFDPLFSSDSHTFIAYRQDYETREWDGVRVWDAYTLKPLSEPLGHGGYRDYGLTFDGKVAFAADAKSVQFWDVATSKLLFVTKITDGKLHHTAISRDGTHFLTIVEGEQAVEVWRTGETHPELRLMGNGPYHAEFDPTGTRIAVQDGPIHIFSSETGREICPPIHSNSLSYYDLTEAFDSTGRRFLVPQWNGFTVVDTATGKTLIAVGLDCNYPHARWSSDSNRIVLTLADEAGVDQPARIYDAATGRLERTIGSHVVECWLGAVGSYALCRPSIDGYGQPLEVWDMLSGKQLQTLDASAVFVSPDASLVLSHSVLGLSDVWRLEPRHPASAPPFSTRPSGSK